MNSWANYHSHTHYCDGKTAPIAYIKEAIRLGLPAYGYSAHAPVSFPTNWCIADSRFDNYIHEVKSLKQKFKNEIEVYLGLEIDYIPGIAGRQRHLLQETQLDYFIGSVHFVDCLDDGRHWNIDTSFELFQEGLLNIFNNDFRKAATRFYELNREMITEEKPNIVGHIDKIKMFNAQGNFFSENELWYRNQIEQTISSLKNQNVIVEINTRGFYKYGQADLYPSQWIIKEMNDADIPLMINSDAHSPTELVEGMPYAAKQLKQIGVKRLHALIGSKWQEFEFNEAGLLF